MMTREEAIKQIEKLKSYCEYMADSDESGAYLFDLDGQALDLALSALRPVSREQVEKVWRSEWINLPYTELFKNKCSQCGKGSDLESDFCPACGAPMTDKAVDMVLERLEEMQNE